MNASPADMAPEEFRAWKKQKQLYWQDRLGLSDVQTKNLTVPMMNQLERCGSDEARRILMDARMQTRGREKSRWKSKSAPPEH